MADTLTINTEETTADEENLPWRQMSSIYVVQLDTGKLSTQSKIGNRIVNDMVCH